MTAKKNDFHIKLISGNNVVLVESQGYETELFMPHIVNGRITLQNIIPNRCCCACGSCNGKLLKNQSDRCEENRTTPLVSKRMTAGQDPKLIQLNKPDASSTPLQTSTLRPPQRCNITQKLAMHPSTIDNINQERFEQRSNSKTTQSYSTMQPTSNNKENINNSNNNTSSQSCAMVQTTPQQARRTMAAGFDAVNDSLVQIPPGIKVIRLYRDLNSPNKRKKDCKESGFIAPSKSDISPLGSPPTPQSQQPFLRHMFSPCLHPPEPLLKNQNPKNGSLPKWRKCLVPIRTYSRRNTTILNTNSGVSLKKPAVLTKFVPSYMANPTQGTKGTHKIEVRKRKIVFDPKVSISPNTFKKQQKGTDTKRTGTCSKLATKRKNFEKNQMPAFDMLTNSNRSNSMSNTLNQQFRNGCLNKASTTCPRFKKLSTLMPNDSKKVPAGDKRHKITINDVASAIKKINFSQGVHHSHKSSGPNIAWRNI